MKTYPSGITATYAVTGSTTINVADGVLNGFGGVTTAQLSPPIPADSKGMQLIVGATNCNAAVATCANRGTMTVTFSRAVTNPVLHVSGLGGSSGTNLFGARMIITGVTGAATLPTYTVLNGTTNFSTQSTTSVGTVAANGGTTCGATPAGGCGSARLNGTFTSVTFRFDLLMSGTTTITSATAGDGIGLTFSVDEDFGDAPASYESGAVASHTVGGLFLGTSVTADNGNVTNPGTLTPSPLAGASAASDGADNGVTFPPALVQGVATTINVAVTGTGGFLQGWIDWGDDGSFATSDRVATNAVDGGAGDTDGAVNGVIRLAVTPPSNASTTPTIARFRVSSTSGIGISGLAPDGEVEDYEVTVTPAADLAVTKTNSVTSVNAGSATTYTVTVTNNGPSSVTSAILTDAVAAGLTKTAIACSGTPGQCTAGTTPTIAQLEGGYTLPALASGQTYQITVTANVTATSGSVANGATIAAPSGTVDPTTSNNTVTDTDTVTPVAELVITKTNGVTTLISGSTTTYTVTVTNNGPSSVTGALIQDVPVSGLTCLATNPVTITGSGVPAGSFTISNLTGTGIALGTLANGQTATLTYSCKVN